MIGLIRQGFARVGLETDQPDRDRVSSDQGFLIGRSGLRSVRSGTTKGMPHGLGKISAPLQAENCPFACALFVRYFRNPCDRDPPTRKFQKLVNSSKIP